MRFSDVKGMKLMMQKKICNNIINEKNNRGSTLVEMVVCFALLGIFMACAAALISSITSIHYSIKGEMISREVSDILMNKIVSEIDGAKYYGEETEAAKYKNPQIDGNTSITMYDKTDTLVTLKRDADKGLVVHYAEILVDGMKANPDSREPMDWYFDDAVYKGFQLTGLSFYRGGSGTVSNAEEYGISDVNLSDYPPNVVLVLMKLKYDNEEDEYHYYRFVRMFNIPEA